MQSGEWIVINGRDYQLGSVLSTGAGSYGQVWAATDATGRAVALKFINTEAMSQADPSQRGHWRAHLEREIVFLAGLDADRSRHIVALLDHGQVNDQPVLVMERLGANLQQWLDQQRQEGAPPPDLTRILDWAEQILAGLEVVHGAGFVYRDLKFSNLLVDGGSPLLKLADFGSLKREDGDSTRSFIGTPATMAPEQVLPVRFGPEGCEYAVDYRADYYALGLLLFALLTGQPATEAQRRLGQLLALYGQEGASQYREQLGGLSDEERELLRRSIEFWTVPALTVPGGGGAAACLTGLIDRLLARDPAGRPDDSAEIHAVLDTVRAGQPIPPVSLPEPAVTASIPDRTTLKPATAPNRHPRRTGVSGRPPRLRRAAGLASLLGLAGAVAWAVFQPGGLLRQDQAEPLSAVIAPAPPAVTPPPPESPAVPEASRMAEPAARTVPAAPLAPTPEPPLDPGNESVAAAPPAPATIPNNDAEPAMPPPEPIEPPVIAAPSRPPVPEAERPVPIQMRKTITRKPAKATPVPAPGVESTAKAVTRATESVTAPPPATVPPAAPMIAKPVPKPSEPVAPERVPHPPPAARAMPAPRQSGTSVSVSRGTRPATASTRSVSAPNRPAAAPAGPIARAERPPRAAIHPRPTPPDLPPIKLESQPQPTPTPPPINLVSRPEPAPVMAPTRPAQVPPRTTSAPRPTSAPPPPARPADPITQFREDAGRAATDIRRQAEAMGNWFSNAGKEIQRGLDSANRAVNSWTGNCDPGNGCGQNARVERRDRWSDRHGPATSSRYAVPPPDNEDGGGAESPPRRPQYYR